MVRLRFSGDEPFIPSHQVSPYLLCTGSGRRSRSVMIRMGGSCSFLRPGRQSNDQESCERNGEALQHGVLQRAEEDYQDNLFSGSASITLIRGEASQSSTPASRLKFGKARSAGVLAIKPPPSQSQVPRVPQFLVGGTAKAATRLRERLSMPEGRSASTG